MKYLEYINTNLNFHGNHNLLPIVREWIRPSNWPEMSKFKSIEGAYMLYDVTGSDDEFFAINGGTNLIIKECDSTGKVINNITPEFIGNVAYFSLKDYSKGLHVFKVTNFDTTFYFPAKVLHNEVYYPGYLQKCVDLIVNLPNITPEELPTGVGSMTFTTNCTQSVDFNMPFNFTDQDYNYGFAGSLSLCEAKVVNNSPIGTADFMFQSCSNLIKLKLHLVADPGTSFYGMFSNCKSLTSVDISSIDMSNVVSTKSMFNGCTSLKEIDLSNFDNNSITDVLQMFINCYSLEYIDFSKFDTSKVTMMCGLFQNCYCLRDINLDNIDTSNVTNMKLMFYGCPVLSKVDVSSFDTSKVTNMSDMFGFDYSLQELDLTNFDTSKVTDMSNMFRYNIGLRSLDLSSFNTAKANTNQMLCITTMLLDLKLGSTWTKNISLNYSTYINTLLTAECIKEIINVLPTVSAQTLTFGADNIAKLSSEDIDAATAKGWTLA